jgi:hypothetical protein
LTRIATKPDRSEKPQRHRVPRERTEPPTCPGETADHADNLVRLNCGSVFVYDIESSANENTHRSHRSTHPPTNAEAQRRRGAERVVGGFVTRRGPGRQMAARDCWAGPPLQTRVPAPVSRPNSLRSQRAQASPLLFFVQDWIEPTSKIDKRGRTAFRAQRPPLCVFASLRGGRVGGLCVLCGSMLGGWVDLCDLWANWVGGRSAALRLRVSALSL